MYELARRLRETSSVDHQAQILVAHRRGLLSASWEAIKDTGITEALVDTANAIRTLVRYLAVVNDLGAVC